MTKEDLATRVRAAIAQVLRTPSATVNPDSNLRDDLRADDLQMIEIDLELEDQFDLPQITDEESEGFRTVADVIAFVAERLGLVEVAA